MTDPHGRAHPPVQSDASIQAVVFDMGGVLLDWDPRHLYRSIFRDEQDMERFLAELDLVAWNVANHDSGARSLDESVAELIDAHPDYATELRAWSERYTEMVNGPIEGAIEILAELRGRVPLYLLSNVPREPIARAASWNGRSSPGSTAR